MTLIGGPSVRLECLAAQRAGPCAEYLLPMYNLELF